MPTYEYGCAACGHEWEEMQRITAPPTEACPKCGKSQAHRLISGGTNFILKGGGWYSDLYSSAKSGAKKSDSNGGSTSDSSSSSTTTSTSTESKSETKSETKTESKAPAAASTPSNSSS